jgi:hypothetical protein
MLVTQYFYLLWRILWLIALENHPTVLPGNAYLAITDTLAVEGMIPPDAPSQIVLSQVPCQCAVEGLGKSDVQCAGHQIESRHPLCRVQDGRLGQTLRPKPSTCYDNTSEGFALETYDSTILAGIKPLCTIALLSGALRC